MKREAAVTAGGGGLAVAVALSLAVWAVVLYQFEQWWCVPAALAAVVCLLRGLVLLLESENQHEQALVWEWWEEKALSTKHEIRNEEGGCRK